MIRKAAALSPRVHLVDATRKLDDIQHHGQSLVGSAQTSPSRRRLPGWSRTGSGDVRSGRRASQRYRPGADRGFHPRRDPKGPRARSAFCGLRTGAAGRREGNLPPGSAPPRSPRAGAHRATLPLPAAVCCLPDAPPLPSAADRAARRLLAHTLRSRAGRGERRGRRQSLRHGTMVGAGTPP